MRYFFRMSQIFKSRRSHHFLVEIFVGFFSKNQPPGQPDWNLQLCRTRGHGITGACCWNHPPIKNKCSWKNGEFFQKGGGNICVNHKHLWLYKLYLYPSLWKHHPRFFSFAEILKVFRKNSETVWTRSYARSFFKCPKLKLSNLTAFRHGEILPPPGNQI